MAKGTFQVSAKRLLGLCLMIFGAVSCTYDYFEDENNFLLYVPQIENNEISRFCVEFHDANGQHVRTRQIEAPFDRDELMKQGILRFKLTPGKYSVSCFADYAPGSITEGESFANSYKRSFVKDPGTDDVYLPRRTNPRALFLQATAHPMGHPDGQDAVTADIDELQCFKGLVTSNFYDLPEEITHIDIFAGGLASRFKFNGDFVRFTPSERMSVTFNTRDLGRGPSDSPLACSDYLIPSAGFNFLTYQTSGNSTGAQSMELEVRYYTADNRLLGTTIVNDSKIPDLEPGNRPTDGVGTELTNLILEPRKKIIFTFKGFTLFKVELKEWGDIVPGETTPM